MDVDHHNPTLPESTRNRYENLYLASRHCNGKKSDHWPTPAQRKLGIRFLDPCAEIDYGQLLFEDPDSFEIWGESPAARYHIRILDLNAPHLVEERRNRFQMWRLYSDPSIVTMLGTQSTAHAGVKAFSDELRQMIPLISQKKKP